MLGLGMILAAAAIPRPAPALEAKDIVGYWEGRQTSPVFDGQQSSSSKVTMDLWIEGGSVTGVATTEDSTIIPLDKVKLEGERLEILALSNPAEPDSGVIARGSVSPEWVFDYVVWRGLISQQPPENEVSKGQLRRIEDSGEPLPDSALTGTFKGSGELADLEGMRADFVMELEVKGDQVKGKITTKTTHRPTPEDLSLTKLRRRHNRVYLECKNGQGRVGYMVGSLSNKGVVLTWILPSVGRGHTALNR
jgi:hypothetical protein